MDLRSQKEKWSRGSLKGVEISGLEALPRFYNCIACLAKDDVIESGSFFCSNQGVRSQRAVKLQVFSFGAYQATDGRAGSTLTAPR